MDSHKSLIISQGRLEDVSTSTNLPIPEGADKLTIQPLTKNIRIELAGATPTTTTGVQLTAGVIYEIDLGEGYTINVIEESATATVEYVFEQRLKDSNA